MRPDDVNRILSREEEILPSAGFVDSVMEAVRQEAAAPPPIPFPWKRALPLLVAGGVTLVLVIAVAVAELSRGGAVSPQSAVTWTSLMPALNTPTKVNAAWTLLALFISFVSVKLSARMAAGGV